LTVGAIQKVKCGASPRGGRDGAQCDSLPFFEEALTKAVRENADCAPADGEGTINYVLQVDFTQASVHVFPGASGKWKGPGARKATRCVKQALPAPNWSAIPHQYRFYQIALLATYRVAQAAPVAAPSGSALFE
jgi:hypothetical protein